MRNSIADLPEDDRAALKAGLRKPILTFLALMTLLAVNVTLGATQSFTQVWAVELVVVAMRALIILLIPMDILHEPPLVRLFSGIGFFSVAFLFGMTLTDYRGRYLGTDRGCSRSQTPLHPETTFGREASAPRPGARPAKFPIVCANCSA